MTGLDTTKPPVRKPWFGRNWWWFLPLIIGTPLLLLACFVGGIFALIFAVITSSQPYQDAVAMVRQDAQIQQMLGTPIQEGWLVMGNLETSGLGSNSTGTADLSIPVYGPKASAQVNVYATKSGGSWTLHEVLLEPVPNGLSPYDVLNPPPPTRPAQPATPAQP